MRSYKSYLCVDTFVTIAFYCMYELYTHSCISLLPISLLLFTICRHSILLYLYVYELCTQLHLPTVLENKR